MVQFPTQEELETTEEIVKPKKTAAQIQAEITKAQTETERITREVETLTADQLKETGEFKISDPDVEQLDTTAANGFLARQKQEAEDEAARLEQERKDKEAAAAKEEKERKKTLAEKFGLTREEKREAEYEELGIDQAAYITERKADIAELEGMWTSYNDKVEARDAALEADRQMTGRGIGLMTKEQQRITNQYNIEINRIAAQINTKSAITAQKQGLMNEARAFAKEAVDDYTYDMQLAYEQFDTFIEENRDILDEIDDKYEAAILEAKEIDYEIWQETKAEKTNVMDLMLSAPTAGITIDDTLEEATEKAGAVAALVGKGLVSETVGGFTVLRDKAGNIISTKVTPAAEGAGKMSLVDIDRAKELYGVDLPPNSTWDDLSKIVEEKSMPRDWSDEELSGLADTAFVNNEDYEQVIAEIDANELIANKDRARFFVDQKYDKLPEEKETIEEQAARRAGIAKQLVPAIGETGEKFWRAVGRRTQRSWQEAKAFFTKLFK